MQYAKLLPQNCFVRIIELFSVQAIKTVEVTVSMLIQGRHMDVGCQLADYLVLIGTSRCVVKELYSNSLICLPPSLSPPQDTNYTFSCRQLASIVVSKFT